MSENTNDRRTRKTKKAICEAFAELLVEKELHKITVREIIEKADISRVTFYNHYLDVYDLHDKFEESLMLEMASLVLELESVPYSEVFSKIIGYVNENRAAFRMVFSPNGTNKMRFRLGNLLEGLLRQLYFEENEGTAGDRNADYMIYYRAQGIILVIQKWVLDDFRESADVITGIMTVLDGRAEENFEAWRKEQQKT
jgi:AcrR family transcriptional regulator